MYLALSISQGTTLSTVVKKSFKIGHNLVPPDLSIFELCLSCTFYAPILKKKKGTLLNLQFTLMPLSFLSHHSAQRVYV